MRLYVNNKCILCSKERTAKGHDPCLGTIPGPVKNACCGHGNIEAAYIQFDNPNYRP